jgi:predicted Zn-dependent protease with MMP-like domain
MGAGIAKMVSTGPEVRVWSGWVRLLICLLRSDVLEMSREQFEELVGEALDRIPPELTRLMDNVAIFVEDEPEPGRTGRPGGSGGSGGSELLGLYEGTPLTERGEWYAGVLPDRITVYRNPMLRICATAEQVVREVGVTVAHEIGHHFGIDDERLHALGYG